ncbi:MAG: putative Ig domain-containing protein [archaeon]
MRSIIFVTLLFWAVFFALLLSGCTDDVTQNNPLIFTGPVVTLETTEGDSYRYSFCSPDYNKSETTCGGLVYAADPSGGDPPYSFEVGYGKGLLPPGLRLNLNGVLEGRSILPGTYEFQICAKDATGNRDCKDVRMIVHSVVSLVIESLGNGEVRYESDEPYITKCETSEKYIGCFIYRSGTIVTLTALPYEGASFEGWSKSCDKTNTGVSAGADYCMLTMDKDESATAEFSSTAPGPVEPPPEPVPEPEPEPTPELELSVDVTVDSASITRCAPSQYDSQMKVMTITAQGTMTSKGASTFSKVSITPVLTNLSFPSDYPDNQGIYKDDLDCGAWKVSAESGYAECVKEAGDPDTATWSLTYSPASSNSVREVTVSAGIWAWPTDGSSKYAKASKLAGTC